MIKKKNIRVENILIYEKEDISMRDYEYAFVMNLHEKLKAKIVGRIFCRVNDLDELWIEITNVDNVKNVIIIRDFSERIRAGWSSDYAAYEVISEYKRIIMSRYFCA